MFPQVLTADSATELWLDMLRYLVTWGERVSPRGMGTVELRPAVMVLRNPRDRWIQVPTRKLSKQLGYTEALLLLTGTSNAALLTKIAPQYANFVNPETGTLDGAYGPRVEPQLSYIRKLLARDPDTRQAVVTIFGVEDHHESRDVPCTVNLHFMVRDEALELIVYMRSNDAWLGWPYDVVMFTVLQEALAADLALKLGQYTHIDGSLHLYDRNRVKAEKILVTGSGYGPHAPDYPMPYVSLEELQVYAAGVLEVYGSEARPVIDAWPPFFRTAIVEGLH